MATANVPTKPAVPKKIEMPASEPGTTPEAAPREPAIYWGDRVGIWIWSVSFFALAAFTGLEILVRQIHALLK
jgi:hypothetical protein